MTPANPSGPFPLLPLQACLATAWHMHSVGYCYPMPTPPRRVVSTLAPNPGRYAGAAELGQSNVGFPPWSVRAETQSVTPPTRPPARVDCTTAIIVIVTVIFLFFYFNCYYYYYCYCCCYFDLIKKNYYYYYHHCYYYYYYIMIIVIIMIMIIVIIIIIIIIIVIVAFAQSFQIRSVQRSAVMKALMPAANAGRYLILSVQITTILCTSTAQK